MRENWLEFFVSIKSICLTDADICKALHRALCCNHSAPQEQSVVASDAPQPEAQASTEVSEVVPAPENAVPAESAPSTESAVVESQPTEPQPSEPAPVEPQAEAPKPEAAGKNLPMFHILLAKVYLACM